MNYAIKQYEDAIETLKVKLKGWTLFQGTNYSEFSRSDGDVKFIFEVNSPVGRYQDDGLINLIIRSAKPVTRWAVPTRVSFKLDGIFSDPFNITKEEAELFRLDYGYNYPQELISGS